MSNLIEALTIFLKYENKRFPTHCEHDVMMVVGITQEEVSERDRSRLDELGFLWSSVHDCWCSYRYGSA